MPDDDAQTAQAPLAAAAERIRGSAQWLLGAFAAVGTILAAGLQLASIGDLDFEQPARFWSAFLGIALAVLGVLTAVAAAASVSGHSDTSLPMLVREPKSLAAKQVADDKSLLQGWTLQTLQAQLVKVSSSAGTAYQKVIDYGNPGSDPVRRAEYESLVTSYTQENAELKRLLAVRSEILEIASFYRVKDAFARAKIGMLAGALTAAVGITAFAWGANPPDKTSLDGGEVLPKTPTEVTLILTPKGISDFGQGIKRTERCDLSRVQAIAFSVDHDTYDLVTVGTEDCNVVRMAVSPTQGQVIPRVAQAAPTPAPTAEVKTDD